MPAGAVNVHGHLDRAAGPTDRHVNVSVEHTDYARGADVRARACPQAPGTERRYGWICRRDWFAEIGRLSRSVFSAVGRGGRHVRRRRPAPPPGRGVTVTTSSPDLGTPYRPAILVHTWSLRASSHGTKC